MKPDWIRQKYAPLSETYLRHVTTRIVRMFELYSRSIDPDDPDFQAYLRHFISARDSRDPETIHYSDLYKMIREGIREYIHKTEREEASPKK